MTNSIKATTHIQFTTKKIIKENQEETDTELLELNLLFESKSFFELNMVTK